MRDDVFQLGLGLVLRLDDADHATADEHQGAGGQDCIGHRGDDQVTRDGQFDAQYGDIERAADMPQHDHEGPGRQHRGQQADHEIDRRVGGQPRILGDAILGVLVLAVPQIDAAIALVAQPGGDQVPADPGAPRTLEGHAAPHGRHRKADAQRREQRQQMGLVPDLAAIAELERIEEVAVPQVEAVLDQELQHRDHDQERDEAPGEPGRRAAPEAARALPEPTEHVTAPRAPASRHQAWPERRLRGGAARRGGPPSRRSNSRLERP